MVKIYCISWSNFIPHGMREYAEYVIDCNIHYYYITTTYYNRLKNGKLIFWHSFMSRN